MKTGFKIFCIIAILGLAFGLLPTNVVSADTEVVYDATSAVLPYNLPSLGFQATQTSEFGDFVHLTGANRNLTSVTVTMSAWALQSSYPTMTDPTGWDHPITVNIYSVTPGSPNVLGSLLDTKTQTFHIPWRPEADPTCPTPTAWRAADGNCYNGYAFNITFDLSTSNVIVPDDIIVGVAYNTNTWGYAPIGAPGPYESLNVGALGSAVVGTDDSTDKVFWNTMTAANYTDGGAGGVGTFREDTNWTPNGTLNLKITADPSPCTTDCYVSTSGSDSNLGNEVSPFLTIEKAISSVNIGGTVHVAAGTYSVTGPLTLNKAGITVQSIDGAATTIIDVQGTGLFNGVEVLANLGDVTFNGFTVQNFTQDGIKQSYTQKEGTAFHVLNNIVIPADDYLRNGIEVTGDGSTVIGNTVYGKLLTVDWASCGIQVDDASNVDVLNNTINGDTIVNFGICVAAWDYDIDDVLIQGNTVSNAENAIGLMTGIYTSQVISNISIIDNTLTDSITGISATSSEYDGSTLVLTLGDQIKIENNDFTGITGNDLLIGADVAAGPALVMDASPNYWGQDNGPTADDILSDALGIPESSIGFIPWCLTNACEAPFGYPPVHNITQNTYFATIQAAITAAVTGDEIHVSPGTYVESLDIIGKDIILRAPSGATIESPVDIATDFTTSAANSAVVYVNTSTTTIDGFTIDGASHGNANYRFYGVAYYNAGGTIENLTVKNIQDTPFSGAQHGNAIYAYNSDSVARTLSVSGNTVYDFQKNGITMNGVLLTANVDDNTVTCKGTTSVTAQNGIQFGWGSTGTITNNTVTGCSYNKDSDPTWNWGAAGVLIYGTDAVTVTGNIISGNSQNLYIQDPTAAITVGANTFGAVTGPVGLSYQVTNFSDFDLDLSLSTFEGLLLSGATPEQLLAFAARVYDGIDDPSLDGIAQLQDGYQFVDAEGSIQAAIDAADPGDIIMVAAGTYDEDVNINKTVSLLGSGAASTTIRGVIGGDTATIRISASNVLLEGFTITRIGNTLADWNNAGLNSMGIGIQGQAVTGTVIQNNIITGNRTGIDINNSNGHSVLNNSITDNRTGMLFRNQTDNMTVTGNDITNNWTVGVLFLDASSGTNSPVQTALNGHFNDNNISGNWYGQVVDRQTGGSLPLPGTTNLKNFIENWWGTTTPVVSTVNSAEPAYAVQIPVAYGGTAVAPGGQPDILGAASANIMYAPVCTDEFCTEFYAPVHNTDLDTYYFSIQPAIDAAAAGNTITVAAGTYTEDLYIDKALTLLGPNASINPNTGSRVAEAVIHPSSSYPNPDECTVMAYLSTSNITIKGFTFDGDNPLMDSGIIINGADVNACEILAGYEGMGNIVVENNILKNSTYSGIDFYNYVNSTATAGNYIRYNLFKDIGETTYNWGIGVLIYNNFYADITDNVFDSVRLGVQTGNFSRANPGTTGSISNNLINAWRLGIFHNLWYSNASTITISGNTINAVDYLGANKWNGILLSSIGTGVNTIISDNDIVIPDTITFPAPGYTAGYNVWNITTTAPLTITGGTVTGGDYGIFVNNWEGYSSNANNTSINIDGVTVLDSAVAGVYVKDSPSNTNNATVFANIQDSTINTDGTGILVEGEQANAQANFNDLSGNPTAGITNLAGTISLVDMDGTNNWWGSYTGPGPVGPGTGTNVSTYVDYSPWCYNADCTDPVHNVTQGTYYMTIQAAIDAANAGDVIELTPMVYVENVVVDQSVEIYSLDPANTIVMPALSAPNTCSGSSLCPGGSNVFLVQADNVKIHDLTIDGDNPDLTSGLVRGSADLDARNGIITNHGVPGLFNGLEIYNVTLRNIYLRGIYASSGGTFNIHHNTVTNVQGEYASIGIFAFYGSGTIANNTVSYANDAISANWSSGIQFLNNIVTNSGSGVHTDNSYGDDVISGNNVSSCTPGGYGVWTFVNYNAITVSNNTVSGCDVAYSAWGSGSTNAVSFNNNTATAPSPNTGSVGIYVTTSEAGYGYADVYANFTGNIISGFDTGVYITANETTWDPDPYVAKKIASTFYHNQFVGNTVMQAYQDTTGTYDIDMEANWWGARLGPAAGTVSASLGYTRWCGDAACTFLYPSLLGEPVSGPKTTWDNIFHWVGVPDAIMYRVVIETADGLQSYVSQFFSAGSGLTCTDGNCTLSPSVTKYLPNGAYRWRILDWSASGNGLWTPYTYFSLNVPYENTLISPGTTLSSWNNVFRWTGIPGTINYRVVISSADGLTTYVNQFFSAGSGVTCVDRDCRLSPTATKGLPSGNYRWQVRSWGPDGYIGSWTPYMYFTLNLPAPKELLSPKDTVTSWTNIFRWYGVTGATMYRLEVSTIDGATTYVSQFFSPSSGLTCVGIDCTVSPTGTKNLPSGTYRWRILDYGTYGAGTWTPYATFTLTTPAPVKELLSPKDTLTSWNNIFHWTGVPDAVMYRVVVTTADGLTTYVSQFFSASSGLTCVGTDCTLSPSATANLPSGNYRWQIREWTALGYGTWTPFTYFTLDLP